MMMVMMMIILRTDLLLWTGNSTCVITQEQTENTEYTHILLEENAEYIHRLLEEKQTKYTHILLEENTKYNTDYWIYVQRQNTEDEAMK